MKAAAFKRQKREGIIDVAKPKAGPGEVVLKVHDCGICGSDLHACSTASGCVPIRYGTRILRRGARDRRWRQRLSAGNASPRCH